MIDRLLPFLALLPVLFGLADFIAGRNYLSLLKLPGRSIWYVGPILIALFSLGGHFIAGLSWLDSLKIAGPIPFTWALWRSVLGWAQFGGQMDPQNARQDAGLMLRNVLSAIPFGLILTFSFAVNWILATAIVLVFSGLCVSANAWLSYEARTQKKDVDPQVDAIHGGLFGFAMWVALLLSHPQVHPS